MQKPSQSSAILILLAGALSLINVACNSENSSKNVINNTQPNAIAPAASPATVVSSSSSPTSRPNLSAKSALPNSPIDTYNLALDKAASALSISESAQSSDDWKLVASRWQQAIKLLEAVPASSANKTNAKTKLAQYQKSLAIAKQKANPPTPDPLVAVNRDFPVQPANQAVKSTPRVFRAAIKYRLGGTPVIEVTFNGREKFDMILDTGASGIVITPRMAAALGVTRVGKVKANTPSQKAAEFEVGFVDSVAVGGAVVRDVPVAIAPQLEVGLLGQDFFAGYDVTIRRDVIEFHIR